MIPTSAEGDRSWYLRRLAAALLALADVAMLSSAAHASQLLSRLSIAPWHAANAHLRAQATTTAAPTSWVGVTGPPGNVYYVAPPVRAVSFPSNDPADLTSASASDNGATLTFTAQTVSMQDPHTTANWTNDDTYVG